jgi:hypothetical protein
VAVVDDTGKAIDSTRSSQPASAKFALNKPCISLNDDGSFVGHGKPRPFAFALAADCHSHYLAAPVVSFCVTSPHDVIAPSDGFCKEGAATLAAFAFRILEFILRDSVFSIAENTDRSMQLAK